MNRQRPSTWIDPLTGLEWQSASPGQRNWYEAQDYAQALDLGGRQDWRLPTLNELESLLDRLRYRPTLRPEVPFGDSLTYWSATTFGPDKQNAWVVMFDGAYVLSYYKTNRYHIRCVRGTFG